MATITRYNFTKGLQLATTPQAASPEQLAIANNVTYKKLGGVKKREGCLSVDTTAAAGIWGSAAFNVSGTVTNFQFGGGLSSDLMRFLNTRGTNGSHISLFTTPSYQNFVRMITMLGTLSGTSAKRAVFFGNGDVPIHTDGTAANTARTTIAAPAAPTVATGVAGALTGDYKYKVTIVNDFGETAAGTASATVSPSGQKVDVSVIPTDSTAEPVKGRARNLWRTLASGSTYYFLTSITDNTTTTYTDNATDASISGNITATATGKASLIPAGLDAAVYFNRLYVANNDNSGGFRAAVPSSVGIRPYRIWISDVDDALSFTGATVVNLSYIDLPTNETITGLSTVNNTLVIFTYDSIWLWNGSNLQQVPGSIGCHWRGSIARSGRYIYFFHSSGFYRFDGTYPELISQAVEPYVQGISSYLQLKGVTHKNSYYCIVQAITNRALIDPRIASTSNIFTNGVFVYDEAVKAWSMWEMNFTGVPSGINSHSYQSGSATVEDNVLHFTTTGGMFQYGEANGDTSTRAVEMNFQTQPDYTGDPSLLKRFTKVTFNFNPASGAQLFYRTSYKDEWKPIGDVREKGCENAIDGIGYFIQFKLIHNEITQPPVMEGFSYEVSVEPKEQPAF